VAGSGLSCLAVRVAACIVGTIELVDLCFQQGLASGIVSGGHVTCCMAVTQQVHVYRRLTHVPGKQINDSLID